MKYKNYKIFNISIKT